MSSRKQSFPSFKLPKKVPSATHGHAGSSHSSHGAAVNRAMRTATMGHGRSVLGVPGGNPPPGPANAFE
ncbi:MAG: hypothetical protein KGL39_15175 [Patescibacteria group bacterium]|nr:hypothetical protein [Patescibacteria group bacterium]